MAELMQHIEYYSKGVGSFIVDHGVRRLLSQSLVCIHHSTYAELVVSVICECRKPSLKERNGGSGEARHVLNVDARSGHACLESLEHPCLLIQAVRGFSKGKVLHPSGFELSEGKGLGRSEPSSDRARRRLQPVVGFWS
jgi:hypothetical protein